MKNSLKFYIDGEWVEPNTLKKLDVINPADESIAGTIALGNEEDVDKAVRAARKAFTTFLLLLLMTEYRCEKINEVYKDRYSEMVETISKEMGAPTWLCKAAQAAMLTAHLKTTINVLKQFSFNESKGKVSIKKEPVGVCGFITPGTGLLTRFQPRCFCACNRLHNGLETNGGSSA